VGCTHETTGGGYRGGVGNPAERGRRSQATG
jgi:hypothetical protein